MSPPLKAALARLPSRFKGGTVFTSPEGGVMDPDNFSGRDWAREGKIALRLIACDDESSAERAQENVLRLLTRARVDLLLGPYSSGLTMAVAAAGARAVRRGRRAGVVMMCP